MALDTDTPVFSTTPEGFKIHTRSGYHSVLPTGIRHIQDSGETSDLGTLIFVDDQTTAFEFMVNLVGLTVYKCLRCAQVIDADDIDGHALTSHLTSKIAITEVPITK